MSKRDKIPSIPDGTIPLLKNFYEHLKYRRQYNVFEVTIFVNLNIIK